MLGPQPLIEGMGRFSGHGGNVGHRQGQIEIHGAEFLDRTGIVKFLAEVVGRNRQHHQPPRTIVILQGLKVIILGRETAERGRIDHKNRPTAERVEIDQAAVNGIEGVSGHSDTGQGSGKREDKRGGGQR